LWDWLNNSCQKFEIERAADGTHVFTSLTGTRVVEVPGASTADGVQLALYDYNGSTCQRWQIAGATAREATDDVEFEDVVSGIQVYPNPVGSTSPWIVEVGEIQKDSPVLVKVISSKGEVIHKIEAVNQSHIPMNVVFNNGLYIIEVFKNGRIVRKKLIVE
jgi:arabinan endo-1,5-alpha-L-arabinosidase